MNITAIQIDKDKPFNVSVNNYGELEISLSNITQDCSDVILNSNAIIKIPDGHIGLVYVFNLESINYNCNELFNVIYPKSSKEVHITLNPTEFKPYMDIVDEHDFYRTYQNITFEYNEPIFENINQYINEVFLKVIVIPQPKITLKIK